MIGFAEARYLYRLDELCFRRGLLNAFARRVRRRHGRRDIRFYERRFSSSGARRERETNQRCKCSAHIQEATAKRNGPGGLVNRDRSPASSTDQLLGACGGRGHFRLAKPERFHR